MRFLLPLVVMLVLFYLLRSILRGLLQNSSQPTLDSESRGTRQAQPNVKMGKMEKDPVCGTFVDVATSIHATFGGEQKFFCSSECLDKFKKSR